MRKTKLLLTAITMSIIMSSTAIAGTWTQDTTGWYYQMMMVLILPINGSRTMTEMVLLK